VAAEGRRVKNGTRKETTLLPAVLWGVRLKETALRTQAVNAFEFRYESFANSRRVAIAGGNSAHVRGVDAEFAGHPGIDSAMKKMPGEKSVSVCVTVT
jgi:hypothetical protein